MTGGDAFKQKLITEDTLLDIVNAYLADPGAFVALGIGKDQINVGAAVLAYPYAVEILAREEATPAQKRQAVKTAILLAPVG